jgi:uncharacterized membrane protein YccC
LAVKAAARAAIFMPAVFGFADGVIGNPNTTLFSAFGSFAILVLADFGGPARRRLYAYLSLVAVGAVLITLGTLCSQTEWLAVAGMAVIGFVILFGRLLGSYFASGAFAAMLLFIIPLGVPGPIDSIPDRLIGWGLATAINVTAVMLLWPQRHNDQLRAGAARSCRALGDLLDPELPPDPAALDERMSTAATAVNDLRLSFIGTPLRPTRPTGPSNALAFLVDGVDRLLTLASAPDPHPLPCREENRDGRSAAAAVLRSSADVLEGRGGTIPLERLEHATDVLEQALPQEVSGSAAARSTSALLEATEPSFRMREIAYLTTEIGLNAFRAVGAAEPEAWRSATRTTAGVLKAHATPSSASFRNSVRGAISLAAAVFVIEIASVQHGFWVALATFSVLRSTALGTGSTIFEALGGTVIGIVIGGAFIYAIGTDETVLWAVLPLAVFLAAYSSRAITFGAGQAGFTVTLLVLFNIIAPTGWQIGLLRVEDVAIGCGISLLIGLLFWPRGIDSLLRESLGAAYARAADYVVAAAQRVAGNGEASAEATLAALRQRANSAAERLDDAFRQYLAEPSAQPVDRDNLAELASGAVHVRLAASSLSNLSPERGGTFTQCGGELISEAHALRTWYGGFAQALERRSGVTPPDPPEEASPVVKCVTNALPDDDVGQGPALGLLWADHHLMDLWRLGEELVTPASRLAHSASGETA